MGGHSLSRILRGYLDSTTADALLAFGRSCPAGAWSAGRQGTGYDKLDLTATPLPVDVAPLIERALAELGGPFVGHDVWLLRYPEGTHIPPHRDENGRGDHHRLNVLLTGPGALRLDGEPVELRAGDAIVFRPDQVNHSVDAVETERWVFSVGAVTRRLG